MYLEQSVACFFIKYIWMEEIFNFLLQAILLVISSLFLDFIFIVPYVVAYMSGVCVCKLLILYYLK